ncbi:hypothetical protein GGI15_004661 [Coemansia interrupta]|uniref:Thioredoxin-like fold domain-containing protein n=1 Tax=Coemansia interrupta TaxID=1126814 RepID=A0A9W8H647_9FUNG|nr:hypothetical protein GGI15_004661 [Coemansia interrupta]
MTLAPAYATGHKLLASSSPTSHTLELFLDYACPFSAKLWRTLETQLLPWLRTEHADRVTVVFRHQVQPWHPNSTLMHEASLAVERLHPQAFGLYSSALFDRQREFYDETTVDMSRTEIYRRLALLATSVNAVNDSVAVLQLLDIQQAASAELARNAGNAVTNDLKYHIKLARAQSIHVSPTVVFDGIRDDGVSSSWSLEQWQAWLGPKLDDQPRL